MKQKSFFVTLWLFCLLLPGVYFLLFAPREASYSEVENRELAALPDANETALFSGSYGQQMETYLLDRFPGRDMIISAVNDIRGSLSFATHEEYLEIAEDPEDLLTAGDVSDDLDALLNATSLPRATPVPTPSPKPNDPTPEPLPTEYPPIVPKERGNWEEYPTALGIYMEADGHTTELHTYSRKNIAAMTTLLDQYASLLPENGKLLFTVVPPAKSANRFVNAEEKTAFYSDWDEAVNQMSADNVFAFDAAEILSDPIKNGEYVFFRQDMHWTPYGTYLVYREMAAQAGKTPANLETDFLLTVEEPFRGTYHRDKPSAYRNVEPDRLDLYQPNFPFEWRRITAPDTYEVIDFLDFDAPKNDRFCVYLGGPAGPWTYAACDNGESENCLVITDSFGLSFIPMLMPNYAQVHYYDTRYFKKAAVGGSVSELIAKYYIQDIYVVVGTLHSYSDEFLLRLGRNQLEYPTA